MNARSYRPAARSHPAPAGCVALLLAVLPAAAAATDLAQLPQRWTEDDGRVLAIDTLAGRRVVLTMAYAGCHAICPQTLTRLQQIERRLSARGERAEFVVVSYDPGADRPADWRSLRASRRLDRSNWHLLSGSVEDTARLSQLLGFEYWKYDEHVMHGMRAVVFDTQGRLQLELGEQSRDWASRM